MSEWENIEGLEGWSRKLGELLEDAAKASQSENFDSRLKENQRLIQFTIESWPNTPEMKRLDEIAYEAAVGLMKQTIEERIAAITSRTGIYQQLAKDIRVQTEANHASADSIRLKAIVKLLDSATETVEAAKAAQEALQSGPDDPELAKKIKLTVTAIENLKKSIGNLTAG